MPMFAEPVVVTFNAGADLSNAQFRFVTSGASDNTVVQAGANAPIVGVLMNRPRAGEGAAVCVFGVVKVVAGGAITRGQYVRSDANGQAVAATPPSGTWGGTTENVAGMALENATAGQLVTILLRPFAYGR